MIVVLIHEGGATTSGLQDDSCQGLSGAIVPILEQLSSEVDVVISGHTHRSYVCDYARVNARKPFLLTSAGHYGTLLTEVRLTVDARKRRVSRKSAHQTIVQGEAYRSAGGQVGLQPEFPVFDADAEVAALVARYSRGAAAGRGRCRAAGRTCQPHAASQWRKRNGAHRGRRHTCGHARCRRGRSATGFVNPGGVRADLLPAADGSVNYG